MALAVLVLLPAVGATGCGAPDRDGGRPRWVDQGAPPGSQTSAAGARVTVPPETVPPGTATPGGPAGSADPRPTTVPGAASGPATGPAGFAALETRLGGTIGYAWVPLGGGKVTGGGQWTTGVAWSTVKVPMAVAAVRAGKPVDANVRMTVTASDNDAAEVVWNSLGPPDTAAAATTAVLRSGGDATSTVPATRLRAGSTVFGQTEWRLADQAIFASRLPCLQGSDQVLGLMGQIQADQRWGLGSAGVPAQFKGGWGPSGSTGYEVRQFGVLTLRDGSQVGVAVAAAPADGTMATGSRNLTTVAQWLVTNGGLTGGKC